MGLVIIWERSNPGIRRYRFMMERSCLNGEDLSKEDLDAICPDAEILVLEGEVHSNWVNSKVLEAHGITDDTPDPVPELAYYVRKNGHVTGNSYETASWPILFDEINNLTDGQISAAIARWLDSSVKYGVTCVFDAGFPEQNGANERIYKYLQDLDKQGKLPVYVDGCYVLTQPGKMKEALEGVKRFRDEFNTEHMKVHTLKIFMDGTLKIETAAMVTPYVDTGALVTWSSDEVFYGDFRNWSPYLAMEIGMTRWINEKTRFAEENRTAAAFPPLSERMNIEEMISGYTINGAKQLGIEAFKGSIEAGKDADFLIFNKDLLTAEQEGFSYNAPAEVYFEGRKVH